MDDKEVAAVLGGMKRTLEYDIDYINVSAHIKSEWEQQVEALDSAIKKMIR